MLRLRTARARLLERALAEGFVKKGNHEIKVHKEMVTFYFRDTPITMWDMIHGTVTQDSHGYDTISTTDNQRKNAEAVAEYRKARVAELCSQQSS